MAWLLTTNRPFPSPPHTSTMSRASGWARGGRLGWRECGGRSAYGHKNATINWRRAVGYGKARHGLPWPMASNESVPHASFSKRTSGTCILGGWGRSWTTLAAALGRGRQGRGPTWPGQRLCVLKIEQAVTWNIKNVRINCSRSN